MSDYRYLCAIFQREVRVWISKGIRNLGATEPKIQCHETIKKIEERLGFSAVRLLSFTVPNTSSATMQMLCRMDNSEMQKRHVLFQEEGRDCYARSMLDVDCIAAD